MQDESTNDFFEFVGSPTSFARQLSENAKEMQEIWKNTDIYDQQPNSK
jgi:hypothetical protein